MLKDDEIALSQICYSLERTEAEIVSTMNRLSHVFKDVRVSPTVRRKAREYYLNLDRQMNLYNKMVEEVYRYRDQGGYIF